MKLKGINWKNIFCLLFILVISGCGGNGSVSTEPPPPPTSEESPFIYGIKLEPEALRKNIVESYFQTANDFGAPYIKIVVGQDAPPVDYDSLSRLAQKYDVSIIPMFLSSDAPEVQTNAEKFAEFVYEFVKKYKTGMNIKYTEFQNEPAAENDGSGSKINMPLSWRGTAEELVAGNNLAYERIKATYPEIMVGSAGFLSDPNAHIKQYTEKFYQRYFKAKPKFDFFSLHNYPKNYSYVQGTEAGDLASQYHIFETYRKMLNGYGYADKPIFITEGFVDTPFEENGKRSWDWADENEAAVLWVEGYMQALSSSSSNNVMGKIITGIRTKGAMGLIDSSSNTKRNQYYLVKYLLSLLKEYPVYSKHIAGSVNSEHYWVEEFENKQGGKMWVAFNPLLYETKDDLHVPVITRKWMKSSQEWTLNVQSGSSVKISMVINDNVQEETKAVSGGKITITLSDTPVFVEEIK